MLALTQKDAFITILKKENSWNSMATVSLKTKCTVFVVCHTESKRIGYVRTKYQYF